MDIDSHYRALDLESDATLQQVKKAYRKVAAMWHPDRVAHNSELYVLAEEKLKSINSSYEIICKRLSNGTVTCATTGEQTQTTHPRSGQPAYDAGYWCQRGDHLEGIELWTGAVTAYRKALKLDQGSLRAYRGLASVFLKTKRLHDARSAAQQIINLAPSLVDGHLYHGTACFHLREYPEAQLALERAARLDPNSESVLNNLGAVYYESGDYEAAARALNKVVRINAKDATAYVNIGWALSKMESWPQALDAFQRAMKLNKHDENTLLGAMQAAGVLGQWSLALQYANRLTSSERTDIAAAVRDIKDIERQARTLGLNMEQFESLYRARTGNR